MTCHIKKFDELTKRQLYNPLKENEGEIIAYLRVLPPGISYPEASIGRVLVKKEYRGEGLAEEMMKKGLAFTQDELNPDSLSPPAYVIQNIN